MKVMTLLNETIQHLQRGCGRQIPHLHLLSASFLLGLGGPPLHKQRGQLGQGQLEEMLVWKRALKQLQGGVSRCRWAQGVLYGSETRPRVPGRLLICSFSAVHCPVWGGGQIMRQGINTWV